MALPLERIRGVFERSPVALTLADMTREDAPLILANDRFSALTGYGASEMLGRNCRFLQRDGENEVARVDVRNAMANGQEVQVILRNYRKNGEVFDNLLFLHPVGFVDGAPQYFVGSQFELTSRPEAALVGAAEAHANGLNEDLRRLTGLSEQLHDERRRHMAETAASLVAVWLGR